ncbi:MAG: hypothetical protein LBC92_05835 [Rickettsiales bacterium]|jgi:hypothetical protein|nr:hypothetical protein [Rickettsiales bacterium]
MVYKPTNIIDEAVYNFENYLNDGYQPSADEQLQKEVRRQKQLEQPRPEPVVDDYKPTNIIDELAYNFENYLNDGYQPSESEKERIEKRKQNIQPHQQYGFPKEMTDDNPSRKDNIIQNWELEKEQVREIPDAFKQYPNYTPIDLKEKKKPTMSIIGDYTPFSFDEEQQPQPQGITKKSNVPLTPQEQQGIQNVGKPVNPLQNERLDNITQQSQQQPQQQPQQQTPNMIYNINGTRANDNETPYTEMNYKYMQDMENIKNKVLEHKGGDIDKSWFKTDEQDYLEYAKQNGLVDEREYNRLKQESGFLDSIRRYYDKNEGWIDPTLLGLGVGMLGAPVGAGVAGLWGLAAGAGGRLQQGEFDNIERGRQTEINRDRRDFDNNNAMAEQQAERDINRDNANKTHQLEMMNIGFKNQRTLANDQNKYDLLKEKIKKNLKGSKKTSAQQKVYDAEDKFLEIVLNKNKTNQPFTKQELAQLQSYLVTILDNGKTDSDFKNAGRVLKSNKTIDNILRILKGTVSDNILSADVPNIIEFANDIIKRREGEV